MTLCRGASRPRVTTCSLATTGDLPQLGVRRSVPLGSGEYRDWRLLGFYEDGLDGAQRLGGNRGW